MHEEKRDACGSSLLPFFRVDGDGEYSALNEVCIATTRSCAPQRVVYVYARRDVWPSAILA